MSKKKVAEEKTIVCNMFCTHLGEADVFMLTLPREHKEAFREVFEKTFKDVVTEKDSNKVKSGVFCETDLHKTPYVTAILVVPPVFPSKMQKLLSDFCMQYGLNLNRYIPDPDQK